MFRRSVRGPGDTTGGENLGKNVEEKSVDREYDCQLIFAALKVSTNENCNIL